jgi:hypothetical protein
MPVPHTKVSGLEERLQAVEIGHADTRLALIKLAEAVKLMLGDQGHRDAAILSRKRVEDVLAELAKT